MGTGGRLQTIVIKWTSNFANGYVYETFGISKHFPVKLQILLIQAETLNNPLTANCFIYDATYWTLFSVIIFSILVLS